MLVKVPEIISKKCREQKCYSDMVFFYQLKSIKDDGFFDIRGIGEYISGCINISISSVHRKLTNLVKLGWVIKDSVGYTLISYNKLFKKLGYDLTYSKKRKRLGSFRIIKLEFDIENFKERIALDDILSNYVRQNHRICKSVSKKEINSVEKTYSMHVYENSGFEEHIYVLKADSPTLNDLSMFMKIENEDGKVINTDISLSCKSIAKLLGYKSTADALKIQYNMVKIGLIKLIKRQLHWKYDESESQLNSILRLRKNWGRCTSIRRKDGFIWSKVLSNQMVILYA